MQSLRKPSPPGPLTLGGGAPNLPSVRVLLTGATGFIGRALCARLQSAGHEVAAWVRSPDRARVQLPPGVELHAVTAEAAAMASAVAGRDAVINLAGEPLFPGRWTEARKARFRTSRVGLTEDLVRAIEAAEPRPGVLVSASAVGYYGDRGEEELSEGSAPGADFLAGLCRDWEEAARRAASLGVRVVNPRIGIVLGGDGGALGQMLLPFRLGLGGRLGPGTQYMSWIHREDLLRLLEAALVDERYHGPVNAVSPNPARNRDFTKALGSALHRPTVLPVPKVALYAAFGEAASTLLASQKVEPKIALSLGFRFQYPKLDAALQSVVQSSK